MYHRRGNITRDTPKTPGAFPWVCGAEHLGLRRAAKGMGDMDNSLRSDKSMLPHNASPHSPRSSIPLRHGKGSGSFGLVDVTDAKEPAFSLPPSARPPYTAPSAPVARPFCTPAFGPRILRPYAPLRADWSGSASGYGGRKLPTYAGGGRGRIFFYIRSMKRGSADRCSSFRQWSY